MRIHYNAPVVLTFALIAIAAFLLNSTIFPGLTNLLFSLHPSFSFGNPMDYFRLVSHVIGHASTPHLLNNLVFILLLGPILEEKYGSRKIFWVMIITAIITGIINLIFSSTGLLGASGIVFAFILLVSIVNVQKHSLPLSFILVALLFIGEELLNSFREDMISQTAHIVGGIIGAAFGFRISKRE